MSKIIDERELMLADIGQSDTPSVGVGVFGHVQVADAFSIICDMTIQERRVLAAKLATHDAVMADHFAEMLMSAVFETGHHDGLLTAPDPGSERHERIRKILKSVLSDEIKFDEVQ